MFYANLEARPGWQGKVRSRIRRLVTDAEGVESDEEVVKSLVRDAGAPNESDARG